MHYSGSFFYRERNAFFFLARLPPHLSCSLFQNLQDLRVTDGKLINEYGFRYNILGTYYLHFI